MTIDFHYHIAGAKLRREISVLPRGCILAQKESDNIRYLEIAAKNEIACGLFAHPRRADWRRTVSIVSTGKAVAYLHVELMEKQDIRSLDPVLVASQERRLPVIMHLSRHDQYVFNQSEAIWCLEYVLDHYPGVRAIVSHCGGENALAIIKTAKRCTRVLLDTSCVRETSKRSLHKNSLRLLHRIAEDIPSSQILFGSDQRWPNYSQTPIELEYLSEIFGPAELEDICIKNGAAILNSLKMPSALH